MAEGYPIVLTADRTLTASYRLLLDGMMAASQTTSAPPAVFGPFLMPQVDRRAARARFAPLGLRRIEAALLAGGFSPEEVAVVSEDQLAAAIGPNTRVIGVSSGEPAGLGMNSSTMTAISGGRIYPQAMFRRLMRKIHRLNRDVRAAIVLGGPGAWQIAGDPPARKQLGIDHVVTGYAEKNAAATFRSLLRRESMPEVIAGDWHPGVPIPPIRGASTMGVVEISRGCGLGCSFCTIARVPMVHLPPQTILADVETNLSAGLANIAVLSEDFFRYGAEGMKVNPECLLSLLDQIRKIPAVRLIQIDHANVASIAQYDERQLAAIHDVLAGRDGRRYVWVNVGVETASEELLSGLASAGKMRREPAEPWGAFCARHLRRLCRAKFFPMASLVIGLPGECDEHLQETLAWVQSLGDERMAVFPLLHAPVDGAAPPDPRTLRPLHWELIKACYRLNFRWVPWFYRDNQAAAGVSWARRTALQLMGYGQILEWTALLAWHHRRSRR
ncbi:MAG: radical SAM protein [Thermoguttaceae bacterium]|jgi:radical SAM superfamily enzyme YgiQ (UPF0313 family)